MKSFVSARPGSDFTLTVPVDAAMAAASAAMLAVVTPPFCAEATEPFFAEDVFFTAEAFVLEVAAFAPEDLATGVLGLLSFSCAVFSLCRMAAGVILRILPDLVICLPIGVLPPKTWRRIRSTSAGFEGVVAGVIGLAAAAGEETLGSAGGDWYACGDATGGGAPADGRPR